jgi:kumamolisin
LAALGSVLLGLSVLSSGLASGASASENRPPRAPVSVSFLAQLRSASRPVCLESWGRGAGIGVSWRPGDSWVTLAGTPAAVGRAFGVRVSAVGGSWSARGAPVLPAEDCGEIAHLGALHSLVRPTMEQSGGAAGGGLSPAQLLNAYDATPLRSLHLAGQGETVVVFEVDAYRASDLSSFAAGVGGPLTLSAPFGNLGKVAGESTMDIETVHEIAPQARVVDVNLLSSKFSGSSTGAVFAEAFDMAAQRWPGAVWSISLGICEDERGVFNPTDLSIMNQAVLHAEQTGTTVFASSGDSGGLECMPQADSGRPPVGAWEGVNVPAALPAVTGVGGTSLTTTATGQRLRETAWTETLLSQGTGGGVSTKFPAPSWQSAVVSATGARGREVPDVSADADPATGTSILEDGRPTLGGGTSLATPIWAGFVALIDEYLRGQGKPALGFLNPALYSLAAGPAPYPAFYDVTVGGNDFFTAGPGYDPVTGLGTPDVWNLARDLSAGAR